MHDRWETVYEVLGSRVRRMIVPGGWIYQVESVQRSRTISEDFPSYEIARAGWGDPLFVADRSTRSRQDSRADDLSITRMRDGWAGSRKKLDLRLRAAIRIAAAALRDCWSAMRRAVRVGRSNRSDTEHDRGVTVDDSSEHPDRRTGR